jgi:signal transduction histidine kinase
MRLNHEVDEEPAAVGRQTFFDALHRWLSETPPGLVIDESDVYGLANYSQLMCLLAHVLFGLVFYGLGLLVPACFNVGSVIVFSVALTLSKRGYVNSTLCICSTEVMAHAWMATYYVGWSAGFHFYVLLAMTSLFLFALIPFALKIAFSVLQMVLYVALFFYSSHHAPVVTLSIRTIDGLAFMNIVIMCVVMSGIDAYYNYAVRTARRMLHKQNHRLITANKRLHEAQDQIIAQQKLAYLGTLTAGIAHEIKNPLNFVNNFSELSVDALAELRTSLEHARPHLSEREREDVDEALGMLEANVSKIREHGKRADRVVQSMLLHAGTSSGTLENTNVNQLVSESISLAKNGAHGNVRSQVELLTDLQPDLPPVKVAARDVARALLNIMGNAVQAAAARASEEGAAFHGQVTVMTRGIDGAVQIRIRDNGYGIEPALATKIFEPFFTTRPTGEGTGLGLSICHDIIVVRHQGRLYVQSEPGSFAEFVVELPLPQDAAADAGDTPAGAGNAGGETSIA